MKTVLNKDDLKRIEAIAAKLAGDHQDQVRRGVLVGRVQGGDHYMLDDVIVPDQESSSFTSHVSRSSLDEAIGSCSNSVLGIVSYIPVCENLDEPPHSKQMRRELKGPCIGLVIDRDIFSDKDYIRKHAYRFITR